MTPDELQKSCTPQYSWDSSIFLVVLKFAVILNMAHFLTIGATNFLFILLVVVMTIFYYPKFEITVTNIKEVIKLYLSKILFSHVLDTHALT